MSRLLPIVLVLLVVNLVATGLLAFNAFAPKHFTYRTDFFRSGEAEQSFRRLDELGWEVVSMRPANDGAQPEPHWGMEILVRSRTH